MDLHGQQYALRVLDIKGNDIPDINQLNYLAGCSVSAGWIKGGGVFKRTHFVKLLASLKKLQHIIVNSDPQHRHQITRINPFCKDSSYDRTRIFDLLPQVRSVDWMDERGAPVGKRMGENRSSLNNPLNSPIS